MKCCFADDKLKNVSLTFVCINHSSSSLTEINLYFFFPLDGLANEKGKTKTKKKPHYLDDERIRSSLIRRKFYSCMIIIKSTF